MTRLVMGVVVISFVVTVSTVLVTDPVIMDPPMSDHIGQTVAHGRGAPWPYAFTLADGIAPSSETAYWVGENFLPTRPRIGDVYVVRFLADWLIWLTVATVGAGLAWVVRGRRAAASPPPQPG